MGDINFCLPTVMGLKIACVWEDYVFLRVNSLNENFDKRIKVVNM